MSRKTREYWLSEIQVLCTDVDCKVMTDSDFYFEFRDELRGFDKHQLEIIARLCDVAHTCGKSDANV